MGQKFKLSKSNKIYLTVIALLTIISFVAFSDKTSYQIGRLFGKLVFISLAPLLFAWIIWLSSGRKEKGASITFNIVLTLVLLGQIGQFGNNLRQSDILLGLKEQQRELKEKVSETDDLAEIDSARNKYVESVKGAFDSLSQNSTGSEKQFYAIMNDFVAESQAAALSWTESFNAVQSSRILDYSVLNSTKEFDSQKNIVNFYIKKTKGYNEFFANLIPGLRKRLSVLGEGNEYAKGAIKGATDKYLTQKPIMEPLLQAHLEYGNNIIQALELLQKHNDMWVYENDELLFYSDNVLKDYNELIEAMASNEAAIDTLSRKILEEM